MIEWDDDAKRGRDKINATGVELASWLVVYFGRFEHNWHNQKARSVVEYAFTNIAKNNAYGDR